MPNTPDPREDRAGRGRRHAGPARPASTLIEISRFALDGMLIEIEAVAVAP